MNLEELKKQLEEMAKAPHKDTQKDQVAVDFVKQVMTEAFSRIFEKLAIMGCNTFNARGDVVSGDNKMRMDFYINKGELK